MTDLDQLEALPTSGLCDNDKDYLIAQARDAAREAMLDAEAFRKHPTYNSEGDPVMLTVVGDRCAHYAAILTALVERDEWQPIETAPRDADILVWFDHAADPYQDPAEPSKLTPYAAWADGGDFLDGKGRAIAKWFPPHFEAEDEYGTGYWMPAAWFAKENGDYERVCNPTHWRPLPAPPTEGRKPTIHTDDCEAMLRPRADCTCLPTEGRK